MPEFEQWWDSPDGFKPMDGAYCIAKRAYAAGQADGKAVPMKYRRMEFNAQLQQELKVAEATLVAAREELKRWPPIADAWHNTCDDLREQLAQSQAREQSLRDALIHHQKLTRPITSSMKALALPTDNSALREHSAKLVERIAIGLHGAYIEPSGLRNIADQIREGKWK